MGTPMDDTALVGVLGLDSALLEHLQHDVRLELIGDLLPERAHPHDHRADGALTGDFDHAHSTFIIATRPLEGLTAARWRAVG